MPLKKREKMILASRLCKETHFNATECEGLLEVYQHFVSGRGKKYKKSDNSETDTKLSREMFWDFLHRAFGFTDHLMMNRVFKTFDPDCDGCISMEEWVIGLSVILKGTRDEQIEYCFKIYNLNDDGDIAKDELLYFLKHSFRHCGEELEDEDPAEAVKDLSEMVIKQLDRDKNGRITFFDFQLAVTYNPNLLQIIGQCLPDETKRKAFLKKIQGLRN